MAYFECTGSNAGYSFICPIPSGARSEQSTDLALTVPYSQALADYAKMRSLRYKLQKGKQKGRHFRVHCILFVVINIRGYQRAQQLESTDH